MQKIAVSSPGIVSHNQYRDNSIRTFFSNLSITQVQSNYNSQDQVAAFVTKNFEIYVFRSLQLAIYSSISTTARILSEDKQAENEII